MSEVSSAAIWAVLKAVDLEVVVGAPMSVVSKALTAEVVRAAIWLLDKVRMSVGVHVRDVSRVQCRDRRGAERREVQVFNATI